MQDTRQALDNRIKELSSRIIELGSMVEQAITQSVNSLRSRDSELAQITYKQDQIINQIRSEIETNALITVATQAPMASDLRLLASVIDIAGELERIGDYAKGIARITIRLENSPPLQDFPQITRMAEITAAMLQRAIDAFLKLDEDSARAIPREDDQVDELYNQLYGELLDTMFHDRNTIDRATFYLWVAHNLERAADRVTNICERTVFTTSAELIEFDRSDDQDEDF